MQCNRNDKNCGGGCKPCYVSILGVIAVLVYAIVVNVT